MAKDPDNLASDLGAESTGGLFTGLLAEEDEFDRRTLWRLGSWGFAAVAAVTLAVLANQSSLGWRRDQAAAADVARQAQQIQMLTKESQNETRRLASAIETLNSDRDRLYARVTVLEQGMDSVTGAIAKQSTAAAPQPVRSPYPAWVQEPSAQPVSVSAPVVAPVAVTAPAPGAPEKSIAEKPPMPASDKPAATASEKPHAEKPPVVVADTAPAATVPASNPDPASATPASLPAMPRVAEKSMIGPPDPAESEPLAPAKPAAAVTASPMPEVIAAAPAASEGDEKAKEDPSAPKAEVQRTEFGVDLGTANSVPGLRALWRGLLKSRSNAPLFNLRPIIVIKEGTNGLGMQLRLVAGPLRDAGAAAKICAVLAENGRACETAVFDGQRLTLKDEPPATTAPNKPAPRRHSAPAPKRAAVVVEEPPKRPEPPPSTVPSAVSTITSLFGRKEQQ
ncbi:hypothetical protein [Bradyrhizobium sp. Ai1a-2]|uniref:hypothetical protein n=1 Tax=Bradyrhizobium sp. Ai1a-2 TaxID=196490 RepID=UPI00068520C5|nr:hypothetical protein [Bradyrhizobium sp. Ai1a-2]